MDENWYTERRKEVKIIKTIILSLALFLLLIVPVSVLAADQQKDKEQVQSPTIHAVLTPSSTGVQVKNQNRIRNEDEVTPTPSFGSNRSQTALQHMSVVAQRVQELLQARISGGIGEQVREVARQQNQAHERIQKQLEKVDSKTGLAKLLFGPDYGALKDLKLQLEQNRQRIEQLQRLQSQLTSQGLQTTIQEAVQALVKENTALQERVNLEEQVKSLFGWMLKFFAR